MIDNSQTCLVIPAFNEAESLAVLLPQVIDKVTKVIVVDNGSTDDTSNVARIAGAQVINEPRRGYGQACLAGIQAALPCDIVIFMDADLCDDPEFLQALISPLLEGDADFVLGSRMGAEAKKYLSPIQRHGNRFACWLMRLRWQSTYTDLGPFRAISTMALEKLNMSDTNYGWTVEMQIKAVRLELCIQEISVPYCHRQFGCSTVSGTLTGIIKAGAKILYVIAREALR